MRLTRKRKLKLPHHRPSEVSLYNMCGYYSPRAQWSLVRQDFVCCRVPAATEDEKQSPFFILHSYVFPILRLPFEIRYMTYHELFTPAGKHEPIAPDIRPFYREFDGEKPPSQRTNSPESFIAMIKSWMLGIKFICTRRSSMPGECSNVSFKVGDGLHGLGRKMDAGAGILHRFRELDSPLSCICDVRLSIDLILRLAFDLFTQHML